jgi:transcriptional regulator with XRE-family HTH domain
MIIGRKIKEVREAIGYSQDFVAYMLGVSQSTYAKYENGKTKITLERLDKISEILKVKVTYFLNEEIENKKKYTEDNETEYFKQAVFSINEKLNFLEVEIKKISEILA